MQEDFQGYIGSGVKGGGINAKRSGLWKEFARLINEIRPKYAIIENVANLRSTGLISVLQDLWKIGYDAEWHCIPASAFGAPHRRDRIWIIAHPACIGKVGLSVGKKKTESAFGDGCKNVSDSDCKEITKTQGFEEIALYAHKSRLACIIAAEELSNGKRTFSTKIKRRPIKP